MNARVTSSLALQPGTDLIGEFRIERVLGAGGFGMTYLATEVALARAVTIKEYFPSDFAQRLPDNAAAARDEDCVADFKWGLDRFIDEAQTLARFDHPNIVKVFRYFRSSGTAYMVLSFEEGASLKEWLRSLGRAPRQREIDDLLPALLDALETIHAADYLHRDIAPDNIMIRKDGSPVLIDFGSARGEIAARTRTVSALVKPGYSPYEQYAESGARQGPWTDIYALGATLYHAICGRRPSDAPSRVVRDELVPVREAVLASYRSRFLDAIDRALALDPARRPQSIAAWRGDLLAPEPRKGGWFGIGSERPAEAAKGGKTVPLPRAQAGQPPLPDVPGAPGQMLDFLEGLQNKPAPAPIEGAGRDEPKRATTAPRVSSKPSPPLAPAPPVPAVVKKQPAPVKVKPPRPKATPGQRAGWRSFAVKFAIGAGLAGGALFFNDGLPARDTAAEQKAALATSKTREPAAKNGQRAAAAGGETSTREAPVRVAVAPRSVPPAPPVVQAPVQPASQSIAPQPIAPAASAVVTAPPQSPQPPIASPTKSISAHKGPVTAVTYSADGAILLTAGADGQLMVWDAGKDKLIRTIKLPSGAASAIAIDANRAITGHGEGTIALWDLDKGRLLQTFKRSASPITSVAFAEGGTRVVAAAQDAMLSTWDPLQPTAPVQTTEAHDGSVAAVAVSPRAPLIASGGADHNVRMWRAGSLDLVRTYRGHRDAITAVAFSPNGRYIAAAAADGRIRVWSATSSSLYRLSSSHKGTVRGLAFSPDGNQLAFAGDDGSVQVWQVRQARGVRALGENGSAALGVAFAPDGQRAAVASADGIIRLWDAPAPGGRSR